MQPRSPSFVLADHSAFLQEESSLSGCIPCNRLVSGSFHPPPGVLFSFPSRYLFAIGLGTYLGLEADASRLPSVKPDRGTLAYGRSPQELTYGTITLYGEAFQPTSAFLGRPPELEAQP